MTVVTVTTAGLVVATTGANEPFGAVIPGTGVWVVATVLVGLCLIPAFFLPRRPAEKPAEAAALMVG